MSNFFTNFATSGFTGLGDLFAQNAAPYIQDFQNSFAPSAKPVNTNSFSFDFSKSFNSLIDLFKPKTQTEQLKDDFFKKAGNLASGVLDIFSNKVLDTLNGNNQLPTSVIATGASAGNPIPSQSFSLSDILGLLNLSQPVAAPTEQQILQQSADNARNSVFLIGGAAILITLLLVRSK